jgi:hypothetical protein
VALIGYTALLVFMQISHNFRHPEGEKQKKSMLPIIF